MANVFVILRTHPDENPVEPPIVYRSGFRTPTLLAALCAALADMGCDEMEGITIKCGAEFGAAYLDENGMDSKILCGWQAIY